MRDSDINSLLMHVDSSLVDIKAAYERSLREKNIPVSLRINVKNLMENLRSCLDYMAQDMAEAVIMPYRKAKKSECAEESLLSVRKG